MSKTLSAIQTLSKIGKIFSKIVFVCCIVGAILCAVGIVCLASGIQDAMLFSGIELHGIIENKTGMSVSGMYASVAAALIICAGEAVLAQFAARYFANELAAGTPFTFDGAKELLRLGILTVAIPLAASIAAWVTRAVVARAMGDMSGLRLECSVSLSLGVMFVAASLLCRYGAEQAQPLAEADDER